MLPQIRDLVATIAFEKRLSLLREEFLERALAGDAPDPEFWDQGEREALSYVERSFYGPEMARSLGAEDGESSGGAGDFEDRSQKVVERALVFSHARLKAIPFVGHPDFQAAATGDSVEGKD